MLKVKVSKYKQAVQKHYQCHSDIVAEADHVRNVANLSTVKSDMINGNS